MNERPSGANIYNIGFIDIVSCIACTNVPMTMLCMNLLTGNPKELELEEINDDDDDDDEFNLTDLSWYSITL